MIFSIHTSLRGITVEYWSKEDDVTTDDARWSDPELIRAFTQDADNFLFEKYIHFARPDSLQTLVIRILTLHHGPSIG